MNAAELRKKAGNCRQLATEADDGTAANLVMLADDYEAEADRLEDEPPAAACPLVSSDNQRPTNSDGS